MRGSLETIALRLLPGSDIRRELEAMVKAENIRAGVIIGAVGSLSQTRLRFANQDMPTELKGKQEILTLSGLLGEDGVHLHMSFGRQPRAVPDRVSVGKDSPTMKRSGIVNQGCSASRHKILVEKQ